MRIPDGPGLGCDPDLDLLNRYTIVGPTRVEHEGSAR